MQLLPMASAWGAGGGAARRMIAGRRRWAAAQYQRTGEARHEGSRGQSTAGGRAGQARPGQGGGQCRAVQEAAQREGQAGPRDRALASQCPDPCRCLDTAHAGAERRRGTWTWAAAGAEADLIVQLLLLALIKNGGQGGLFPVVLCEELGGRGRVRLCELVDAARRGAARLGVGLGSQ